MQKMKTTEQTIRQTQKPVIKAYLDTKRNVLEISGCYYCCNSNSMKQANYSNGADVMLVSLKDLRDNDEVEFQLVTVYTVYPVDYN